MREKCVCAHVPTHPPTRARTHACSLARTHACTLVRCTENATDAKRAKRVECGGKRERGERERARARERERARARCVGEETHAHMPRLPPGFLKKTQDFEEQVEEGATRYILEGTGSCTPAGEPGIELEPGTLLECRAPTTLSWKVATPLVILTPQFEQGKIFAGFALALFGG